MFDPVMFFHTYRSMTLNTYRKNFLTLFFFSFFFTENVISMLVEKIDGEPKLFFSHNPETQT